MGDFNFSDFADALFSRRNILPNNWERSHLCEKQLTCNDINLTENEIDSFFEQELMRIKNEKQKTVQIDDKMSGDIEHPKVLSNGDMSVEAIYEEYLNIYTLIGDDISNSYQQNFIKGNLVNETDSNITDKIYS